MRRRMVVFESQDLIRPLLDDTAGDPLLASHASTVTVAPSNAKHPSKWEIAVISLDVSPILS